MDLDIWGNDSDEKEMSFNGKNSTIMHLKEKNIQQKNTS